MKINKKINYFLVFMLSLFCFNNVKAVYTDANVGSYESELEKFPCEYQEKIKELHNIYPNAIFVKQDKFFDYKYYKEVEVKWEDMLAAETKYSINKQGVVTAKSLIESSSKYATDIHQSGNWYVASKEGVEYYMNPYNFLDEKHVFMFKSQFYSDYETLEGINNILTEYFKNKECPGADGKTYAEVILEVSKKYNISAYMMASRLRQENGSGTSTLVTGGCVETGEECKKYYNLYNIQASGSTNEETINNGLKCAAGTLVRKTNKGDTLVCKGYNWDSPYASILGAAKFIREDYIGVNDTYNVKGQMTNYLQKWDPYGNVYAGHQYMQNIRAPYFESETTYKANIGFSGKNVKYVFYIPIFQGAPNTSNSCNITEEEIKINLGDVNGDENIDSSDLLKIRQHLIGVKKIEGNFLVAADVNKDGNVDSSDLLKVRQHLIGIKKIEG